MGTLVATKRNEFAPPQAAIESGSHHQLISIVCASFLLSSCAYSKHLEGRVLDTGKNPIPNATVLMAVNRGCDVLGGVAPHQLDKVVATRTDEKGRFHITASKAWNPFSYCLEKRTWSTSTNLFVCKNGSWIAKRDRPSEAISSGDIIFDNPFSVKDGLPADFNSFPQKIKNGCETERGP
jgi:hypothetical protein